MTNEAAYKRHLLQARRVAAKKLRGTGYGVFTFDDGPFSIIAVRPAEARFVRVIVGKIGPGDVSICQNIPVPPGCVREVWARLGNTENFEMKHIQ